MAACIICMRRVARVDVLRAVRLVPGAALWEEHCLGLHAGHVAGGCMQPTAEAGGGVLPDPLACAAVPG